MREVSVAFLIVALANCSRPVGEQAVSTGQTAPAPLAAVNRVPFWPVPSDAARTKYGFATKTVISPRNSTRPADHPRMMAVFEIVTYDHTGKIVQKQPMAMILLDKLTDAGWADIYGDVAVGERRRVWQPDKNTVVDLTLLGLTK
ncbi:MAG: hypothetical protein JOZ54_12080 [Acidobacteria bacterium]|nr:hypothetical protein [Acidobacteriota bacterium]